MPDDRTPIRRVHNEASAITEQNALMRDQIARALQVLKTKLPDTFLGRKTHEPFPSESDAERNR